jgi:hypothetical protein
VRLAAPEVVVPLVFHEASSLPLVRVRFEGRDEGLCVIDTGAEVSFLIATMSRRLGLRGTERSAEIGAGGATASRSVRIVRMGEFRLGDAAFLETDFLEVAEADWFPGLAHCVGVLSLEAFGDTCVVLDYPGSTLAVRDAEEGIPASAVRLDRVGRRPFVAATLAGHAVSLLVDTGSETFVNLASLWEGRLEYRFGPVPGHLIHTIARSERERLARVRGELRVGPFAVPDPVVSLRPRAGGHGSIGSDFLRHFRVTFDASKRWMLLEGGSRGPIGADPVRTTGVVFRVAGGAWCVVDVIPESSAATEGVAVDDEIVSVNGRPTSELEAADWIRACAASRVDAELRRADGTYRVALEPRDLVPEAASAAK